MFSSRSRVLTAAAATALTATALVSCGSDDSASNETLTFAAVPAESSTTLEQSFGNITELLKKEVGVDIQFQNASDYAAVIEGMRAGQVDLGSFGPFSYVIAKDSGVELEPIAARTDDANELPAYTSLAYVAADSDIDSLEDLKGKTVCFVDQASTSGYLVPMKGLMDVGIDMNSDLTAQMAGGHDASLLSLASGDCDAAFAHDAMLTTLSESGQIDASKVKAIWESDPITEDPLTINTATVSPELVEKITTVIREKANIPALVEAGICEDAQSCVLPEETTYGYVAVTDADFNSIRELCAATKADACRNVA